jgi:hypothetical protein
MLKKWLIKKEHYKHKFKIKINKFKPW